MTIRVGRGKTAVEITGPLADGMMDELRSALGPVLAEIEREGEALLENAQKTWPVKTGKSKDGLYVVTQLDPETYKVSAQMMSKEGYAPYIKSTKVGKKVDSVRLRAPLQTELRAPGKEAQARLKVALPEILAAHLTKEVTSG